MDRRTFLKIAGMGSLAFAASCSPENDKRLFSLVTAPTDMVTGKSSWYASNWAMPSFKPVLVPTNQTRTTRTG